MANHATVNVRLVDLPAVRAVLGQADRLARAVQDADPALLEPHIQRAFEDYKATREEWTKK